MTFESIRGSFTFTLYRVIVELVVGVCFFCFVLLWIFAADIGPFESKIRDSQSNFRMFCVIAIVTKKRSTL